MLDGDNQRHRTNAKTLKTFFLQVKYTIISAFLNSLQITQEIERLTMNLCETEKNLFAWQRKQQSEKSAERIRDNLK